MEKLEKHIKQKLQGREINPSKEAWEKIEAGLGQNPKNRSGRRFRNWYAVAAIFMGLLVSTLFYFNLKNDSSNTSEIPEIVNTENILNEEKKDVEIVTTQESKDSNTVKDNVVAVSPEVRQQTSGVLEKSEQDTAIDDELLKDNFPETQQLLIDQKVDEVFAQVRLLESQNDAVTDAEVDSLLRAAQREVMADRLFESDGSVDAMALLNEVEDELDKSFRDDIFNALKEGYTKLKTAVADRNN